MKEEITTSLNTFQDVATKLGQRVSQAGALWSDKKFVELSDAIGTIASQSVAVLEAGDTLLEDIDRFQEIAQERY